MRALTARWSNLRASLLGDSGVQTVAANAGWLFGSNVVGSIANFAQGLVIARLLGPKSFGFVILITTLTVTAAQIFDSRSWVVTIRFLGEYLESGEHAKARAIIKAGYLLDALTGTATLALLVVGSRWAAHIFLKDTSAAPYFVLYAVTLVLAAPSGTASAVLRVANRFDVLAYGRAGEAIFRLLATAVLVAVGLSISRVLAVYVAASVGATLFLVVSANRAARSVLGLTRQFSTRLTMLRRDGRRIVRLFAYSNLSATAALVTLNADTLLLGWLASPGTVGIYQVAKTISTSFTNVIDPIYSAVYPETVRLVASRRLHQVRALSLKIGLTAGTLAVAFAASVTVFAPTVVPLLFGTRYATAVVPTQVLAWCALWGFVVWTPGLLLATDRARTLAILNVADSLAYVAFLALLIPTWGAHGAAIATLSHYVAVSVAAVALTIPALKTQRSTETSAPNPAHQFELQQEMEMVDGSI